jgi:hypothetical protein
MELSKTMETRTNLKEINNGKIFYKLLQTLRADVECRSQL